MALNLPNIYRCSKYRSPLKLSGRHTGSQWIFLVYFIDINFTFFCYVDFLGLLEKADMTTITPVVMVIKYFSHLSVQCSTPALHLMLLRVLIWVIVMLCLAWISSMPCRLHTLKRRTYLRLFKHMRNTIQTFYYEVFLFMYLSLSLGGKSKYQLQYQCVSKKMSTANPWSQCGLSKGTLNRVEQGKLHMI